MWLQWCIHGFINCISEISNTQIEDAHDIDVVMSMYKLIEYTDIYSKMTGGLWQYYRDEPTLGNNGNKIDFSACNNNSVLFKFNQQTTGQTRNNGTNEV